MTGRRGLLASLGLLLAATLSGRGAQSAEAPCIPDREPNDELASAMPLAGAFCIEGELAPSDQDIFTWDADGGGRRGALVHRAGGHERPADLLAGASAQASGRGRDGPDARLTALRPRRRSSGGPERLGGVILQPGAYLLGIVASDGSGPYRLRFTPAAAADARKSSRTTPSSRRPPLVPETTIAADLQGSVDLYRWTLDAQQARQHWRLEVLAPVEEWVSLTLELPDGRQLLSHSESAAGPIEMPGPRASRRHLHLAFLAGRDAAKPYRIRLVPEAAPRVASREDEPNDTPAVARPLALAKPLTGRLGRYGDVDYYSFEVGPQLQGKRLDLSLETAGKDPRTLCLGDSERYDLQCRDGTQPKLPDLLLSPGRYMVHVSGASDAGEEPYTLTLRLAGVKRPGYEAEPNDQQKHATPLGGERTVRGRFVGKDVDFYAFEVEGKPQLWRVTAKGRGVQTLAVLDRQGAILGAGTAKPDADGAEVSDTFLLPGPYFVSVAGADAEYSLALEPTGPPDMSAEREPNDDELLAHRLRFDAPRTGRLTDSPTRTTTASRSRRRRMSRWRSCRRPAPTCGSAWNGATPRRSGRPARRARRRSSTTPGSTPATT